MTRRLSESTIVADLAEQVCKRITRSTIRGLQSMERGLSPEDSGLENPWDEICVQVQCQESIYRSRLDELMPDHWQALHSAGARPAASPSPPVPAAGRPVPVAV